MVMRPRLPPNGRPDPGSAIGLDCVRKCGSDRRTSDMHARQGRRRVTRREAFGSQQINQSQCGKSQSRGLASRRLHLAPGTLTCPHRDVVGTNVAMASAAAQGLSIGTQVLAPGTETSVEWGARTRVAARGRSRRGRLSRPRSVGQAGRSWLWRRRGRQRCGDRVVPDRKTIARVRGPVRWPRRWRCPGVGRSRCEPATETPPGTVGEVCGTRSSPSSACPAGTGRSCRCW